MRTEIERHETMNVEGNSVYYLVRYRRWFRWMYLLNDHGTPIAYMDKNTAEIAARSL